MVEADWQVQVLSTATRMVTAPPPSSLRVMGSLLAVETRRTVSSWEVADMAVLSKGVGLIGETQGWIAKTQTAMSITPRTIVAAAPR